MILAGAGLEPGAVFPNDTRGVDAYMVTTRLLIRNRAGRSDTYARCGHYVIRGVWRFPCVHEIRQTKHTVLSQLTSLETASFIPPLLVVDLVHQLAPRIDVGACAKHRSLSSPLFSRPPSSFASRRARVVIGHWLDSIFIRTPEEQRSARLLVYFLLYIYYTSMQNFEFLQLQELFSRD